MKSCLDSETRDALSQRRVFLGHQSVGSNILTGIEHICLKRTDMRLRIVESVDPSAYVEPVLGHARIGTNRHPITKIDAFADIMNSGLGNRVDIALFKLCYIDITENTNIDAVFSHYSHVMKGLVERYPKTVFVHTTVPVTVMPNLLHRQIGRLLRRHNRIAHENLRRAEYNTRLRTAYHGKAPIFDLAAIESTSPSGRRNRFVVNGRVCEFLIPGYSSDGRHLSTLGGQVVANALLDNLARVTLAAPKPSLANPR